MCCQEKLLDIFKNHAQIVDNPWNTSGYLVVHISIKKTLMEELFTNATVKNSYLLDHDVVRILIDENAVDFHTILQNSIWSGNRGDFNGLLGF